MSRIQNLSDVEQSIELIGEDINVFGDVYEESIIDAHTLSVKGTTHSNSTQFSKFAQINEHRGTLRCHDAQIDTLNGGEIHATNVIIESCLSGSVYAQNVTIKNVSNNLKVYASDSITIGSINGSHNCFTIDYRSVPILVSKLELIEEDIQELTLLLHKSKEDNAPTQQDIELEIIRLQTKSEDIKSSIKDAKIEITNSVNGENTIRFTIDANNSVDYKTKKSTYTPFYLEFTSDKIILHPTETIITSKHL